MNEDQAKLDATEYGPRNCPPGFSDHSFKTDSGVYLAVRIWPADPPVDEPAPVVFYTHGGGWFAGNHFVPLPWMQPGFRQRGYHMVSHNFRLGPQASYEMQLQDSLDAVSWCRANLPSILGTDTVDVSQLILCGESGGALLTGLMGHHLSPPPKAVILVYGIVDPAAAWPIVAPVPENSGVAPPWVGEFSDNELEEFLKDRDETNMLTDALWADEHKTSSEQVLSRRWATDFRFTRRIRLQAELHQWRSDIAARIGSTVRSVRLGSLHAERFADEAALTAFLLSMSPSPLLETKTWYPPTAFLHGMDDRAAPLAQSQAMARRLKTMNVPVVESYEPNEDHVFDHKYTSSDVPGWDTYIQPILDFCNQHIW
ncbi:Alpha/beta hydrolase fold-3 [Penicillium lagena]|uniref:Alpha/beta hydrolase fold-3 n=1 Tax=Penicillium lagena TaxID=94218 RepID=UPI0025409E78|nr:Alpha/beta hydrolase fold-3 [Penicillium lagena]KAJ5626339.1 Alpha/beta hydrolase fold-3 [Penicillium lagena]